jgi:CBS-domain-containing membrane protein
MPETSLPHLMRDLMTVDVLTCTPQTTVPQLAQILLDRDLDKVVVLDDVKSLGVVGQDDLIKAFARDNCKLLTASDVIWKNLSKDARRLVKKNNNCEG